MSDYLTTLATLPPSGRRYIGDGVDASFDGYQFWLDTDGNVIAVNPEVLLNLIAFALEVGMLTKRSQCAAPTSSDQPSST